MRYTVTFNADMLPDEPTTTHDDYKSALDALITRMGEIHYDDMADTFSQGNDYDLSYRWTFKQIDDDHVSMTITQIVHADEFNPVDQSFPIATITHEA